MYSHLILLNKITTCNDTCHSVIRETTKTVTFSLISTVRPDSTFTLVFSTNQTSSSVDESIESHVISILDKMSDADALLSQNQRPSIGLKFEKKLSDTERSTRVCIFLFLHILMLKFSVFLCENWREMRFTPRPHAFPCSWCCHSKVALNYN